MKINWLIVLVVAFIILFFNFTYIKAFFEIYPFNFQNSLYFISTMVVYGALLVIIFSIVGWRLTIKPLLIVILLISSLVAYFMDSYKVVISKDMIQNVFETNLNETKDLLSLKLFLYLIFLGILPSIFIYKISLKKEPFKRELLSKIKIILGSILIIVIAMVPFNKFYTSYFREHKILRKYFNPAEWIYSLAIYLKPKKEYKLKIIGEDAKQIKRDNKRKIVIVVVGETARSDHFSLNGYKRDTNPKLSKDNIFSFKNFYSCGTSTATSVPCMFSIYDYKNFDDTKAFYTQNILDILKRVGVKVLWRDNNSDSKGVAVRVDYEDFKSSKKNKMCDIECRDEGMLIGLDRFIKDNPNKDILIILHTMGSHGPAYYKRYPKRFEKFKPVCKTNQLEKCSKEEIINAYDNTILYSDYFLDKSIDFLKRYKDAKRALIYISDHGESLGEGGLYLHGMPYFIAPDAQKHVAAFIWLGDNLKKEIDTNYLRSLQNKKLHQNILFHTLLAIFDVNSSVYKEDLNILKRRD